MKKLRWFLYPILAVFLILFVVGTFFDLDIAKAIFDRNDGVSLFFAAFGFMPGCGVFAFLGGALFANSFLNKDKKAIRIILIFLALVAVVGSIVFSFGEIFGVNGYNLPDKKYFGLLIAAPIMIAIAAGGYFFTKDNTNKNLWIPIIVLLVCILLAYFAGTTALKNIFHRPRFRLVVNEGYAPFHYWYERCTNYSQIIERYDFITKEEFKSFPSGHTNITGSLIALTMFLPMLRPTLNKKVNYTLIGGAIFYTFFIGFTRMRLGAHYLTDISMGGLLSVVLTLIFNEIVADNKKINVIAFPNDKNEEVEIK